jgi:uncharacterized membrane protein YhiD involved in acid resistance
MGILKVAITILGAILLPYLLFVLPKRVRKNHGARTRYYIFFIAALFIIIVVKIFR